MPAAAVAKRTPAIGGSSGIVFGASGETEGAVVEEAEILEEAMAKLQCVMARIMTRGWPFQTKTASPACLGPAIHDFVPPRFKAMDGRYKVKLNEIRDEP